MRGQRDDQRELQEKGESRSVIVGVAEPLAKVDGVFTAWTMFGILSQTLFGAWISAAAVAPSGNHAAVRLLAGPTVRDVSSERWLGLEFRLTPGWHVYWRNPGDAGSPPTVQWTLPAGWRLGDLQFPLPERIEVPPLTAFGYEDRVVYPIKLQARAGTGVVRGKVSWVVCKVECIAEEDSLILDLSASTAPTDSNRALVEAAVALLPVPLPAASRVSAGASGADITLSVDGLPRGTTGKVDFFPAEPGVIEHSATVGVVASRDGMTLRLTRSRYASVPPERLRGLFVVRPEGVDADVRSYEIDVPVHATRALVAGRTGPVALLSLALLSGLLVNLMPCVFPLLAIKALSLASTAHAAGERGVRAAMYAAGSVGSAVAIGSALVLAKGPAGGAWGFQMQSPRFLGLVALVTFVAGLSLIGVFEAPNLWPSWLDKRAGRLSANASAFTTGAAAILVGAPCTAPFFGATLAGAVAAPRAVGLATFAAFGFGAAAPLVALALSPSLQRHVPKPGRWMETLKQLLAFPLFAATAWLLWIAQIQTGPNGSAVLLGALCAVAFAAWVLGRWRIVTATRRVRVLSLITCVSLMVMAARRVATLDVASPVAPESAAGLRWQTYTDARLDSLLAAGRPVLVDFTAAWCLTCKVNELGALSTARVAQAVRARSVGLLRADLTVPDTTVTRALHAAGGASVPTYVLYPAGKRSDWQLLPPLLTPGVVVDAIERSAATHVSSAPPRHP